jgi:hypothetical protein
LKRDSDGGDRGHDESHCDGVIGKDADYTGVGLARAGGAEPSTGQDAAKAMSWEVKLFGEEERVVVNDFKGQVRRRGDASHGGVGKEVARLADAEWRVAESVELRVVACSADERPAVDRRAVAIEGRKERRGDWNGRDGRREEESALRDVTGVALDRTRGCGVEQREVGELSGLAFGANDETFQRHSVDVAAEGVAWHDPGFCGTWGASEQRRYDHRRRLDLDAATTIHREESVRI